MEHGHNKPIRGQIGEKVLEVVFLKAQLTTNFCLCVCVLITHLTQHWEETIFNTLVILEAYMLASLTGNLTYIWGDGNFCGATNGPNGL